jgi:hypothetical protein
MEFGRWMAQLQNLSEKRVDFASIRRSQIPICYFRTGIQDVSYRWDKDPCPRGTQRWKSKLEISHVFSEKKILLCQDSILSFWLRHKLWLSKPFYLIFKIYGFVRQNFSCYNVQKKEQYFHISPQKTGTPRLPALYRLLYSWVMPRWVLPLGHIHHLPLAWWREIL